MPDTWIWLADDGELEDVRGALQGAGLRVDRRPSAAWRSSRRPVLLGSVARVADHREEVPEAIAVAVVGIDERAPVSHLDAWVRRPVHPMVLGVLLDALGHSGVERRWAPRVAIGAPARAWTRHGVRRTTLVDLSVSGCRLLTATPAEVGSRMLVWLPRGPGWRWPLAVTGRVLRCEPGVWDRPTPHAVSLGFTRTPLSARRRVQALLQHHAGARLAPAAPRAVARTAPDDRRARGRLPFERRVIARRPEGATVLQARDLSVGGLRIAPTADLDVGSEVQLAVHVKPGTTPLVVDARVARDDGAEGLMLRFENLDRRRHDYLAKMIGELGDADAEIVSELLLPSAR